MPGLRVLFLGGTGIISFACSWRAVERGIELFVLRNPYLQYSRDKIACEEMLRAAYRDEVSDKLARAFRPGA
jgi:hypothetical protein